jgi:hypothetical protein
MLTPDCNCVELEALQLGIPEMCGYIDCPEDTMPDALWRACIVAVAMDQFVMPHIGPFEPIPQEPQYVRRAHAYRRREV